jgi:hypothetical protein
VPVHSTPPIDLHQNQSIPAPVVNTPPPRSLPQINQHPVIAPVPDRPVPHVEQYVAPRQNPVVSAPRYVAPPTPPPSQAPAQNQTHNANQNSDHNSDKDKQKH